MSLAQRLREETRELHGQVEKSPFIRCFLKGALDLEGFTEFLDALYDVYFHLEEGLRTKGESAALAPFRRAELLRTEALAKDLRRLRGADYVERRGPSPAAALYVQHLNKVIAERPELLTAHAYVRYLGDLAGGQALRRIAERSFAAAVPEGFVFFEFPMIPDVRGFMQEFRVALDSFAPKAVSADEVVAEALTAFRLNGGLFQALEPALRARIGEERFQLAQAV